MKRYTLTILALCLALLLSACGSDQPQPTFQTPATAGSTEPTETTAATSPATDSTVPSATEPSALDPALWQPAHEPLSYEDFFKEDRPLRSGSTTWYTQRSSGLTTAHVAWENNVLVIRANAAVGSHIVPGSEALKELELVSSDGIYAYLCSDTQILRVKLLTGETEILEECDRFLQLVPSRHVMFYFAIRGDSISVRRLHLPSGTVDVICDGLPLEREQQRLAFSGLYSTTTHSDVSWTYDNPALIAKLQSILADPESSYREEFGALWDNAEAISIMYSPNFSHTVQDDFDIPAFVKETFSVTSGTHSQCYGRIDTCSYGSGYPHDHYNPNHYDVDPVWKVTAPVSLPGLSEFPDSQTFYDMEYAKSSMAVDAFDAGDGRYMMYQRNDVFYTPAYDQPIIGYVKLGSAVFCTTEENTLVQVIPGVCHSTVYTAKNGSLRALRFAFGRLYFLDGDMLMEIDIPARTCVQLMQIPYFSRMYPMGPRQMYIDTHFGMSFGGYECDFNTQTYNENYHL